MRFVYEYRDSDNVRHEGSVCAASREEAFGVLRAQGIRPARMQEAPGVLNKLLGRGKRWIAITALVATGSGLSVALLSSRQEVATIRDTLELVAESTGNGSVLPVAPRHQIYGDPVVIRRLAIATELARLFDNPGDVVLAAFAQPGPRVRLADESAAACAAALEKAVEGELNIVESDPREVKELKAIVNGMKQELREYVRSEGCTPQGYYQKMLSRSRREVQIVERVKRELEGASDLAVWEQKNAQLRKIGLRPVDIPDSLFRSQEEKLPNPIDSVQRKE